MSRKKKLLHRFDRAGQCMEIGPGYSPLLPKRDGWQTLSVDHADRAGLVEKYRRFDVDIDAIEEVDVIWQGELLDAVIPKHMLGKVDACVASHVIEHIPNPVAFFQSMTRILKPGGWLSLAVPDKRYCFDFFQPITGTGDWLHAWKRGARIHSQRGLFQHIAYTVKADGLTTWTQGDHLRDFRFLTESLPLALERFQIYAESDGAYQDCHAWHFTPASFRLMILELAQLGLIPFAVEEFYPSNGCEFYVLLRNAPPSPLREDELNRQRLVLLRETVADLAEQARLLRNNMCRSWFNSMRRRVVGIVRPILRRYRNRRA